MVVARSGQTRSWHKLKVGLAQSVASGIFQPLQLAHWFDLH